MSRIYILFGSFLNILNMKTLKELYEMLLTEVENSGYKKGICICISDLWIDHITMEEMNSIERDFLTRKPNIYSKFFWNWSYIQTSFKDTYWWKRNKKGHEQRIKFLKHIIKTL